MKVFGEVKLPREYMNGDDDRIHDYLQDRIVDHIAKELLRLNAIKFTEEYAQGYYIMHGEVEVEQ